MEYFLHREDLSDDRIEELLNEAEHRLRAKQNAVALQGSTVTHAVGTSLPKLDTGTKVAKPRSVLLTGNTPAELPIQDWTESEPLIVELRRQKLKAKVPKSKAPTAGPDWFNLPRSEVTPEIKRDYQLLRMRSVLDPQRHFKKDGTETATPPQFFQTGIVQEGPTEYFSARIDKRNRKNNFAEEVLASGSKSYYNDRFGKIQKTKSSGKRKHYKDLKEKRAKTRR
ncbi:MAG: hypothetical protein M1814_002829 [Vezdaea aestivalis]|nr:MAG: hypothetical protein M1814_002829 [Vezdaea aestivalis]